MVSSQRVGFEAPLKLPQRKMATEENHIIKGKGACVIEIKTVSFKQSSALCAVFQKF